MRARYARQIREAVLAARVPHSRRIFPYTFYAEHGFLPSRRPLFMSAWRRAGGDKPPTSSPTAPGGAAQPIGVLAVTTLLLLTGCTAGPLTYGTITAKEIHQAWTQTAPNTGPISHPESYVFALQEGSETGSVTVSLSTYSEYQVGQYYELAN